MSLSDKVVLELLPIYAALERTGFLLQCDGERYDSASPRCRLRRIGQSVELLWRSAKAAVQGGDLLISFGVTNGAQERLEDLARQTLRYRAGLLLPIDIKEFTCRCAGRNATLRAAVQQLPEGRLLSQIPLGTEDLPEAISALEQGMTLRGVSFGELREESIIYGTDRKLYPFSYAEIQFGIPRKQIHEECNTLRKRLGVAETEPKDDLRDPYKNSLIDSDRGYLQCRTPHEDRIAVENEQGWGFIDSEGLVIVEPKYHWVSDFYEGRAEVRITKNGEFKTIDRNGKILPGHSNQ